MHNQLFTFIETHEFSRNWKSLNYDDDDLRELELFILDSPEAAPVIQGTGGLRKLRYARGNRGKSSGVRVCYVNFLDYGLIYLITVYAKNEQDNLTHEQRNNIYKLISQLERSLQNGRLRKHYNRFDRSS